MTSLVFSAAMNLVVVGLLIGLWAWVLLPGLLRERRNASPLETVNRFERSMDTLAQTGGDPAVDEGAGRQVLVLGDAERVVSGRARTRAELRRRAVLARVGFVLAVTLVAGIALGGWWWTPAALVGVPYVVYAGLVIRLERRLSQQRDMLHDLDAERERRQPVVPEYDATAIEVAVGDESGLIVTGWQKPDSSSTP
ncbi:hypothetical protein BH23ACT10_BH23ACT10_21620 [soil metagenome]